ncbi:MAG: TPM domain-containing protein [Caulobacteraceae bacterium]
MHSASASRQVSFGAAAAVFLVVILALLGLSAPARAALTFPPLTGRVVDDANVLTPDIVAELTQKLAALQAKNGRQLVVVTLPSLQGQEIEDYGYQLGRAWGIGQKGTNTGALFIVVPSEHKVRIEVGYGLEPILTDAETSVILQQNVLPKFRAGDVSGGVVDGTDALVQQLGLDDASAQAAAAQATTLQQQVRTQPRHHNALGSIVAFMLVIFVLSAFFRGGRRGGGMGWILPLMFMGGGGFGGGGNDDDDRGGGGGFSGGGGSFGGGGSSGSW